MNSNIFETATLPNTLYDPSIYFKFSLFSCHFFYNPMVPFLQPQFLTQLPPRTLHVPGPAFRIV